MVPSKQLNMKNDVSDATNMNSLFSVQCADATDSLR